MARIHTKEMNPNKVQKPKMRPIVTVLHNCKTGPTCLEETKHFTSSKANSGSSRATCERNADPHAGFPP